MAGNDKSPNCYLVLKSEYKTSNDHAVNWLSLDRLSF